MSSLWFGCFFFFNDTPTTEIYTLSDTLSLHDALPSSSRRRPSGCSSMRPWLPDEQEAREDHRETQEVRELEHARCAGERGGPARRHDEHPDGDDHVRERSATVVPLPKEDPRGPERPGDEHDAADAAAHASEDPG